MTTRKIGGFPRFKRPDPAPAAAPVAEAPAADVVVAPPTPAQRPVGMSSFPSRPTPPRSPAPPISPDYKPTPGRLLARFGVITQPQASRPASPSGRPAEIVSPAPSAPEPAAPVAVEQPAEPRTGFARLPTPDASVEESPAGMYWPCAREKYTRPHEWWDERFERDRALMKRQGPKLTKRQYLFLGIPAPPDAYVPPGTLPSIWDVPAESAKPLDASPMGPRPMMPAPPSRVPMTPTNPPSTQPAPEKRSSSWPPNPKRPEAKPSPTLTADDIPFD
jgi:hypothetical protein